ncbi:Protein dispatched homolog 1 (Mdispa) [Durusdinium trenchii]|uniref:Protein dispatched homolog 1 (Mdispa) n=1 Tax=Durusdinium trenchii TaxID=1381693 RepID=A0ABP0SN05_9DINO
MNSEAGDLSEGDGPKSDQEPCEGSADGHCGNIQDCREESAKQHREEGESCDNGEHGEMCGREIGTGGGERDEHWMEHGDTDRIDQGLSQNDAGLSQRHEDGKNDKDEGDHGKVLSEHVTGSAQSHVEPAPAMEVGGVLPPSPTGTCSMVADAKHLGGKRAEPAETAVTSGPRCRITCKDFPFCTAHCPFLFCILVFSAMPLVLALLWPGIVVNSDTSVFLEADSRSSTIRTAFLGALPFRDASSRDRRLMTGPMPPIDLNDMYKMDQLNLYYRALGSPGLLASESITLIRQFELDLRSGPLYQRVCHELSTPGLGIGCDPGHSIANAAFPSGGENASDEQAFVNMRMDGHGLKLLRQDVILEILQSKDAYQELMLPKDFQPGEPLMSARSFFAFNIVCCRIEHSASQRSQGLEKARREWSNMLAAEVLPKLMRFEREHPTIQLNFAGGSISTMQLWEILASDCLFAIGSVVFIIGYLTMHAGSLLLSCGSMLLTVAAIPSAFVLSAVLSGSNEVTGAAFLSIFLIAGLGADVVLVFINFWEISKSADEPSSPRNAPKSTAPPRPTAERVKFVYRHAGLACLGTTLTTAASFFANLASVLRALREFGFFMGMCIIGAYVYLVVGLPALLILNDGAAKLRCCHCRCRGSRRAANSPATERSCRCCKRQRCEGILVGYRILFFLFFLLLVVGFGLWTGSAIELDTGVPQMFPDGHNLNDIEDVAGGFQASGEQWTQDDLRFCNFMVSEDRQDFLRCTLHQCQITQEGPFTVIGHNGSQGVGNSSGEAECQCFPSEVPSTNCKTTPDEGVILVRVRVVGEVPKKALEAWRRTGSFRLLAKQAAQQTNPFFWREIESAIDQAFFQWLPNADSKALTQEFWETGEVWSTRYDVLPNFIIPIKRNGSLELCHTDRLCYCGAPVCTYAGRRLVDPVMPNVSWDKVFVPLPARRLQPADAPDEPDAPAMPETPLRSAGARRLAGGADIALVWGLRTNEQMPLLGKPEQAWSFEEAFRVQAPATQRVLLSACSLGEKNPALLIQVSHCWLRDFRTYATDRGYPFPVPSTSFQVLFQRFLDGRVLGNGILAKDYMWLTDDFQLKATYIQFIVPLNYMTTLSSTILALMEEWDKEVEEINQNAPVELGTTWHTSSLWLRAEAERAIVNSTVLTMVVSAACGFLGALFFTHGDLLLSWMVVLNVMGVTISLAWFMVVFMGWAIGVLEILGLIVFVGYSITYSLHIAHKYQEHTLTAASAQLGSLYERRREAVLYALNCMSSSILGSAITTLGSSFFLFFCQLVIFVKLATVLSSVTFFACLFATVAFPAALLCIGPVGTSCQHLLHHPDLLTHPLDPPPPEPRGHVRTRRSPKPAAGSPERQMSKLARSIPLENSTTSDIFFAAHAQASRPATRPRPEGRAKVSNLDSMAITVL